MKDVVVGTEEEEYEIRYTPQCAMSGAGSKNDYFYNYGFSSNERHFATGQGSLSQFFLERTPVVTDTLSGSVISGGINTYSFCLTGNRVSFVVESVSQYAPVDFVMNYDTGVVSVIWDKPPGPHEFIFNYEYSMELNY